MAPPFQSPDYRFARRTQTGSLPQHRPDLGPCLIWTGGRTTRGYGRMSIAGREQYVHRWAYERFVGPIPAGLDLDHLCRRPECARVEHLQPVAHQINVLRGEGPTAAFARRTECSKGHGYTAANTFTPPRRIARVSSLQPRILSDPLPAPTCATGGSRMSGFVVIRHPEAGIGTAPVDALVGLRALGWIRVSEPRNQPDDFRLTDYADAPDLDAEPAATATPEPEPAAKPAKAAATTTKESKE